MKVIYKYLVPLTADFRLSLPPLAQVLSVQMQNGSPQMWVLQDANLANSTQERRFMVIGTGHQIPDNLSSVHHLGTFQMNDGVFVWHVFEVMS